MSAPRAVTRGGSDPRAPVPPESERGGGSPLTRARRAGTLVAVAALAVVGAVAVTRLVAPAPAASHHNPNDRLAREFAGAYPETVRPTGVVREVSLDAAPTSLPLLDGRSLEVWAYNGQVPGPTIRVRRGDALRVRFTNHLPQPTTVHWHGVRLSNAMDGVPGVTQPPIAPGATFVYEFVPKDAGTFWFHPHVRGSEQVERGLYGVLIVEDRDPPPYSREVVWVLDDWRLEPGGAAIDPRFNTRHDLAHDGRWGSIVTVAGRTDTRLTVRPGERIRLRLLDAANGRVFVPDFGELDARAIAVDGLYAARPLEPAGLELAPGNRLDLDITIPASAAGRSFAVVDRFTRTPTPLATIDVARAQAVPTPAFASPASARVPAWREAETLPTRAEYRLDARRGGELGIEWTFNGVAFHHGETGEGAPRGAAAHAAQTLPRGAFSKLRFVNDSYRLHPIHLHGMFFRVLSRDGRPVDEPFFRDTALVHPRETVEIGVVPLDAGRWMMHCHVLEHAEAGMMTLLEVPETRG